jgi:succinoglycan biosynthesis transport protein ExoP
MTAILERARERYDYIFIDLPPVVPVVDAKAIASFVDSFVFVIEWAKTSRDVVREAVLGTEAVRQRVVGAVLNKADTSELRRIESYRGETYTSYYTDDERAA